MASTPITIKSTGQRFTVTVTPGAYTDAALTTPVTFPINISTDTTWYVASPTSAQVLVTLLDATVVVNQAITFAAGSSGVITPALTTDQLRQVVANSAVNFASRQTAQGVRGVPVVLDAYIASKNSGSRTTAWGTSRIPFRVSMACGDLRLLYPFWSSQGASFLDTDNLGPTTIAASIEYSGTIYPVLFGGSLNTTVDGGGYRVSDPIAVDVPAGATIYVRTATIPTTHTGVTTTSASATIADPSIAATDYGRSVTGTGIPASSFVGTVTPGTSYTLSSASGSQAGSLTASASGTVTLTYGPVLFSNRSIPGGPGGYGGFTASVNLTPVGSAAISDATSFTNVYTAGAILGVPQTSFVPPSVLHIGDSIDSAVNDGATLAAGFNTIASRLGGGGWLARALAGRGGIMHVATAGDTASSCRAIGAHFRKFPMATYCSTAVCGYGTNDISSGASLATVQGNVIALWTMMQQRGLRVLQRTLIPHSLSTDGWLTTTNQSLYSTEAVRAAFNTWLRDGAPMNAGAAVATGTNGALRAGANGHPLYSVLDVCAPLESTAGSGFWNVPADPGRTVTDMIATAAGFTAQSATAAFTSADLGKSVVITGAGTSGGTYVGSIAGINSATSISLTLSTPTAVSAATGVIIDSMTEDGLHPKYAASILMANAVDTSKFI